MERPTGFTLLEMLIAIAVLGLLATLGVPSMTSFFEKNRVVDASSAIYENLQLARSEALARFASISVVVSGSGSSWTLGVSENAACNPALTDPANTSACRLSIDVDLDGTTGESGEWELHRLSSGDFPAVTLSSVTSGGVITFEPHQGLVSNAPASGASISLQSTGSQAYLIRVKVKPLGGVRMCSPSGVSGASRVVGFSDGSCGT